MPRFRRVVVPGFPHHVTDRGNRRSNVFLDDSDRLVFLHSLHENAEHHLLRIFAYSLMRNHFHLVCTPEGDYPIARTMHDVLGSYGKIADQRNQGNSSDVPGFLSLSPDASWTRSGNMLPCKLTAYWSPMTSL
jgi:REP element-mobilizing transposase RayT